MNNLHFLNYVYDFSRSLNLQILLGVVVIVKFHQTVILYSVFPNNGNVSKSVFNLEFTDELLY